MKDLSEARRIVEQQRGEIESLKAKLAELAEAGQWVNPNDKTQNQFLPHIGERVLFCHGGKTYYGKHTGGSFISFTNPGKYYPTWDCHWMYPPKAIDAAIERSNRTQKAES